MKKIFNIKNYVEKKECIGRIAANKIKNDVNKFWEKDYNIVFNFKGIKICSHNFIDEMIGYFIKQNYEKALKKLHFVKCKDAKGIDNDIKAYVSFVFANRRSP